MRVMVNLPNGDVMFPMFWDQTVAIAYCNRGFANGDFVGYTITFDDGRVISA